MTLFQRMTMRTMVGVMVLVTIWTANSAQAVEVNTGSYTDLNYKELLQNYVRQGVPPEQRRDLLAQVSQERLEQFLLDGERIPASSLDRNALNDLYSKFYTGIVSEEADMGLPLDYRNTICYLRAMWVHMHLLSLGAEEESIRKLVLEGFIQHEIGTPWDYHIVLAVKAADKQWYVFDLESGQLMELRVWMKNYLELQVSSSFQSYQFLFSVRPSHQYTLVDLTYNLELDFGAPIKSLLTDVLAGDKVFSEQIHSYIQRQKTPALCLKSL
ncbi:MAG: hypothetical protein AAGB31_11925 [Bdellovibrio sp.]